MILNSTLLHYFTSSDLKRRTMYQNIEKKKIQTWKNEFKDILQTRITSKKIQRNKYFIENYYSNLLPFPRTQSVDTISPNFLASFTRLVHSQLHSQDERETKIPRLTLLAFLLPTEKIADKNKMNEEKIVI